jgi:hypothetical protein
MTFGQVEVTASSERSEAVLLHGERGALRVAYDPWQVRPSVELLRDVDLADGPRDVRRVRFALREPARKAQIRLRIEAV